MFSPVGVTAFLLISGAVGLMAMVWRWNQTYWTVRTRLREEIDGDAQRREQTAPSHGLTRWLSLAGYRRPYASRIFLLLTCSLAGFGGLLAYLLTASGLLRTAIVGLRLLPGGVGDIFLPAVYLAPWLVACLVASLPFVVVRATRRKLVERVNEDLPITLELLATLSEVGLGFDAALDRVIGSQDRDRPLAREFRAFQLEVLSGRPRVECLRRMARRIDVTPLTVFVSALVQAEQIGMGLAGVLRQQANDLRDRRRERALEFAMTLPVKLMFPMIICFLPGIFIFAIGPAFYQFFQFAENMSRTKGL
ncbi:MAG: type secretion system protein [Schlesneria sp.]|nr:type secretion system protein [Schlesneria sp.]